jgi:MarR family transcriptional regulator for hemolysin
MVKYDFGNSIGFVVNNTAKFFQRALDNDLRKNAGVTLSHWKVVWVLDLQSGLTQKEIADKLGIEGATLVPILDKMEQDGMLNRKPDSQDRRVNRIYLSSKVDSLRESMSECALRIRKSSTKDIQESDIRTTLETLRKISKNLETSFEIEKNHLNKKTISRVSS